MAFFVDSSYDPIVSDTAKWSTVVRLGFTYRRSRWSRYTRPVGAIYIQK